MNKLIVDVDSYCQGYEKSMTGIAFDANALDVREVILHNQPALTWTA